MTIPSGLHNVYDVAKNVYQQINQVKKVCDNIAASASVKVLEESYQDLCVIRKYLNELSPTEYDRTKIGQAMAVQYGVSDYTAYEASYDSLVDVLLPALINKIKSKESERNAAAPKNTDTGSIDYGTLDQVDRDDILVDVNACLAEFS